MDEVKNENKLNRLIFMISIVSYIGIIICVPFLPANIPINWDINWIASKYGSKYWILFYGATPLLWMLLLYFVSKINILEFKNKVNSKVFRRCNLIIVFLCIIMAWLTVMSAFDSEFQVKFIFQTVIGLACLVLGNYMPTLKSNYLIGVRSPWTLKNKENWRKSNRMGGYFLLILGIFILIAGTISFPYLEVFLIIYVVVGNIMLVLYSYVIERKNK